MGIWYQVSGIRYLVSVYSIRYQISQDSINDGIENKAVWSRVCGLFSIQHPVSVWRHSFFLFSSIILLYFSSRMIYLSFQESLCLIASSRLRGWLYVSSGSSIT